jgi:tripartite-type tricarboxylate transporter receptor subunit TctC
MVRDTQDIPKRENYPLPDGPNSKRWFIVRFKNGTNLSVILTLLALCLLFVGSTEAQDYPKRPVQIVIPYSPGGLTDLFWRSLSESLARNIRGTIAIVNKPGGSGILGTSFATNSKPDGYTLVNISPETVSISPAVLADLPYDVEKDITYIGKASVIPFCIAVPGGSSFKTLEEMVAFVRANPRKLKAGVTGIGSVPQMIVTTLNRDAGIYLQSASFSEGEITNSLLGGHIDVGVISLSTIRSQFQAGKVRILAVCTPKRLPDMPQIATMVEKGYPGSSIATALGLGGPRRLAPAIVNKWEEALARTLKEPKIIEVIHKLDGVVIDYKTGEEYKKELMADLANFRQVVSRTPVRK